MKRYLMTLLVLTFSLNLVGQSTTYQDLVHHPRYYQVYFDSTQEGNKTIVKKVNQQEPRDLLAPSYIDSMIEALWAIKLDSLSKSMKPDTVFLVDTFYAEVEPVDSAYISELANFKDSILSNRLNNETRVEENLPMNINVTQDNQDISGGEIKPESIAFGLILTLLFLFMPMLLSRQAVFGVFLFGFVLIPGLIVMGQVEKPGKGRFEGTSPISPSYVYIPEAFSPNGDGMNDSLKPITREVFYFTMDIYTIKGIYVTTLEKNQSWGGLDTPQVYLYLAEWKNSDGTMGRKAGRLIQSN